VALRRWASALRAGSNSELVVVPVGYGKTIIGFGSFEVAANLDGADICLYLAPTDVLRSQVYGGVERAADAIGSTRPLRKMLADNANLGRAAAANIIVATYQQVAAAPGPYVALANARRVHLVCDEAHHLGERGTWAAAVGSIPARTTMLLSATPVRLDGQALAGARYRTDAEGHQCIAPLLEVSMRQAWREGGILKRLQLQMKDYTVQLRNGDGEVFEFTASEMAELGDFDQRAVRQQLRWNDDYVHPLVQEFALTVVEKQRAQPGQHQGLVFAATAAHADHLANVFARTHPDLRCAVVHSVGIEDAQNERRMRDFHAGRVDVLIQVRKASEGFDRPPVSVLLKLDAVFSREPVIQQIGRGLRYNHSTSDAANVLHVFVGRDPRLAPIIEHLEREASVSDLTLRLNRSDHGGPGLREGELEADLAEEDPAHPGIEIVDVVEAGDAILDHTGQYLDGQQLALFGGPAAPAAPARPVAAPANIEVVDLHAEIREAIDYARTWTNRLARLRAERFGAGQNHHAGVNLDYARASGRRGALRTAAEYRAKGDWMRAQYALLIG
jgi:superfamily II DNA or RNA helicase